MHRISARLQTVSVRGSPNHRMTDFFTVTGKTSFYCKFLTLHVNSVQCESYIRLSEQTPGAYHTSSRPIAASRYLTEANRPAPTFSVMAAKAFSRLLSKNGMTFILLLIVPKLRFNKSTDVSKT